MPQDLSDLALLPFVFSLHFQHLFRASTRKPCETNPERALVVPAGTDSLDTILKATPPGTRREDFLSGNAVAEGAMDAWKRAVEDVFGAADLSGWLTTTVVLAPIIGVDDGSIDFYKHCLQPAQKFRSMIPRNSCIYLAGADGHNSVGSPEYVAIIRRVQ